MKKLSFLFIVVIGLTKNVFCLSTLNINGSEIIINGSNSTLFGPSRGPASSAATPTLVQSSCAATVNGASFALTFNSSVTVGNTTMGGYVDGGEAFTSVADTGSNVYTTWDGGGIGNGSARSAIYVSTNTKNGGLLKVTLTTSGTPITNGCIAEISNVTSKDVTKTASVTGTNPTSGNYTSSGSPSFCASIMSHSSAGTALTPGSGQTQIGEDENNSAHQTYNMEYFTPSSGTNASTWTSSSVAYVIDVLCVK